MKISVVIPTYNCARYLAGAIESVLSQTYPAGEILVVDDGSTDDTEAVMAAYLPHVHYISQANAGPSAARNHGIREASGEVVGFLDADDTWHPHTLSRVVQCFDANPSVALVTADKEVIDCVGAVKDASWWSRHGLAETLYGFGCRPIPQAFALLLQTNFVNTSLAFVRRSALERSGLFDETIRFGEDWELWLRIVARDSVACIPEVLGQYRVHDANVTRATEAMLQDLVRVTKKIAQWGEADIRRTGRKPEELIADALCNLGYWYFSNGKHSLARGFLLESLSRHLTKRALKYVACCLLPSPLLNSLQRRSKRARLQSVPDPDNNFTAH